MDSSGWANVTGGTTSSGSGDGRGSTPLGRSLSRHSSGLGGMGGSSSNQPFDPMDFARLSPSSFDPASFNNSFVMPRFAANTAASYGGYDVAIAEPDRTSASRAFGNDFGDNYFGSSAFTPSGYNLGNPSPLPAHSPLPNLENDPSSYSYYSAATPQQHQPQQQPQQAPQLSSNPGHTRQSASRQAPQSGHSQQQVQQHQRDAGPVYAPYGSSVVSLNASMPFKAPQIPMPPTQAPTAPFSPSALGLPVPPAEGTATNFAGLYSSSGFDMLSVLARVAARPNPTINIGPVDTSCSFLVVDARKYDFPIVFASETFTKLTGYSSDEIIGKNCRFLQSPDASTVQGQPRKYTDSQAAWHMRQHIGAGKESQSSLINYQKGGKAFINLVTIIPISWDNADEIAYYVGFQVDLVQQPNAILDRMKDGSYVVNYSLLNNPAKSISMLSIEPEGDQDIETIEITEQKPIIGAVEEDEEMNSAEVWNIIEREGLAGLSGEEEKREWHKLMFENSEDLIHVLSLKGSILYCSASSSKVLEYDPSELIGRTIQSVCHPSDIVPVMRELKDSGNISTPYVSLLYRVQRKHSGYIWLEATGKLHVEPGKGRKCVILVGRPRSVFKLSWSDLRASGGLGDSEFWSKISPEGMVLSSTASVEGVLGFRQDEMVGTSLFQLIKPETVLDIQQALSAADGGRLMTVQHKLKSRKGFIDVVSRFYPREDPAILAQGIPGPAHNGVIVQINELASFEFKRKSLFSKQAPEHFTGSEYMSPTTENDTTDPDAAPAKFQSTFKTLAHPSAMSFNVFDELDTTRCTSWQYELHQLQILNKRLRDERDHLCRVTRKRPSDFGVPSYKAARAPSESSKGSRASSSYGRSCANCGRTDSPEWRAGPTGTKSLCNACGLRWAKTRKERSSSSDDTGSTSMSGLDSRSPTVDFNFVASPVLTR